MWYSKLPPWKPSLQEFNIGFYNIPPHHHFLIFVACCEASLVEVDFCHISHKSICSCVASLLTNIFTYLGSYTEQDIVAYPSILWVWSKWTHAAHKSPCFFRHMQFTKATPDPRPLEDILNRKSDCHGRRETYNFSSIIVWNEIHLLSQFPTFAFHLQQYF